ncbi:MAG: hypothetical protein H3C58_01845 [Fimbriimonadaceae bacterium]|nr:hypothetical protein [Fimbriimonadaceae bacterium]
MCNKQHVTVVLAAAIALANSAQADAWVYRVTFTTPPVEDPRSPAKEASDTSRALRLAGVPKETVERNGEFLIRAAQEARKGRTVEGKAKIAVGDGWMVSEHPAPVLGAGQCTEKQVYRDGASMFWIQGERIARVFPDQRLSIVGSIASQFVLGRRLAESAPVAKRVSDGLPVDVYTTTVKAFELEPYQARMEVHFADENRSKVSRVDYHRQFTDKSWFLNERYDLTDGRIANGKLSFASVRLTRFRPDGAVAQDLLYTPESQIEETAVDRNLGIPVGTHVLDKRLGEEVPYEWTGEWLDLDALREVQQSETIVAKNHAEPFAPKPWHYGVALIAFGTAVAYLGRRRRA